MGETVGRIQTIVDYNYKILHENLENLSSYYLG